MAESYFKKLAEDLLNIEINTIVKADMSAIKLPSSRREALYELSRDYHLKLEELEVRDPIYWRFAGLRSFEELWDRAKKGEGTYEEKIRKASPEEQVELGQKIKMLERIEAQSSQMIHIFRVLAQKVMEYTLKQTPGYLSAPEPVGVEELRKRGGEEKAKEHRDSWIWNNDIERNSMNEVADLDLTPEQVNRIRKAWEISTEQIQLQTVIQIDGDVATRISEAFLRNINKTLLEIHNNSIVTATGFWQSLVKAFGEIAGKAIDLILGKP